MYCEFEHGGGRGLSEMVPGRDGRRWSLPSWGGLRSGGNVSGVEQLWRLTICRIQGS